MCAIDSRGGHVAIHGWKTITAITPSAMMQALEPYCSAFLYTHIDTEGLMQGIPIEIVSDLRRQTDRQLIAAGGIRSREEIESWTTSVSMRWWGWRSIQDSSSSKRTTTHFSQGQRVVAERCVRRQEQSATRSRFAVRAEQHLRGNSSAVRRTALRTIASPSPMPPVVVTAGVVDAVEWLEEQRQALLRERPDRYRGPKAPPVPSSRRRRIVDASPCAGIKQSRCARCFRWRCAAGRDRR